ncbi:unnamed protein product [Spirodela intermedia]|uniref:Aspergillus nuclease S1 n=1 Tax=Spirodela intermedia TaxID=51605 RepID=A0A7I8KWN7_SPIIN|nr:unnamed protein product [Spirodela intermedia]
MGFFWRLLPVFLAYFSIGRIDAWGREGHFMVCKIAEKFLTENAREAVANLLPPVARGDLAAVCSWADDILTRYPWSFPLHYVNTPGVCNYDQSRDCHNDDGVQGMCVVGAINNYTTQLRTFGQPFSRYNLTESLMFLAHLVGDVHDPVDVSFYDDEGGIFIIVYWYGSKTNLHRVWDVNIVQTAINKIYKNNVNAMIESIEGNITENWNGEIIQWQSCASNDLTCVTE